MNEGRLDKWVKAAKLTPWTFGEFMMIANDGYADAILEREGKGKQAAA